MDNENFETRLYPFSKIIQASDQGKLTFLPENLNAILTSWDSSLLSVPSRFIAVTGGSKSGKTFLTNLIIRYYESRGVNWLNSLVNRRAGDCEIINLRGFCWGSVKLPSLIPCDNANGEEGAVYLYPKPFLMQDSSTSILVWVLHIDIGLEAAANEEVNLSIEQFLLLVCSHLVEILYSAKRFRLLNHTNQMLKRGVKKDKICQSVSYILRAPEDSPSYSTFPKPNAKKEETGKYLGELWRKCELAKTKTSSSSEQNLEKLEPNSFENSTVIKLINYPKPLHEKDGFVCFEAMKTLHLQFHNVVQDVVTKVSASSTKVVKLESGIGNELTGENMRMFLTRVVEAVNQLNFPTPAPTPTPRMETRGREKTPEYQHQHHHHHRPLTQVTLPPPPPRTEKSGLQNSSETFEILLKTQLLKKIDTSLTYSNIPTLFRDCYNQVVGSSDHVPISQEMKENYWVQIDKLISIVEGYCSAIKRYFAYNYVCFLEYKTLERFCDRELDDSLKALGSDTTTPNKSFPFEELVRKSCEKLRQTFLQDNQRILSNEEEMGSMLVGKIRDFYKSEMSRYVKEIDINKYSQEQLENNHKKLVAECVTLFRQCSNCKEKLNEVMAIKEKELNTCLDQAYNEHRYLIQSQKVKKVNVKPKPKQNTYQQQRQGQATQQPEKVTKGPKLLGLAPAQQRLLTQSQFSWSTTLIFHLTLDEFTVGRLNPEPELLASELAMVGISNQKDYLFGSEVLNCGDPGVRICTFDGLLEGGNNPSAAGSFAITTEYLVGMLTRKLKNDAEARTGTQFSRAVITCPFWMRDEHRADFERGTKTYAGFDQVQIVNENECIIQTFLNSVDLSRSQKRGILALSHNSGSIDIGLHIVDQQLKTSMLIRDSVADSEDGKIQRVLTFLHFSSPKKNLKNLLKDVHSDYARIIAASVISSTGDKTIEPFLEKLKLFPPIHYFSDSRLAVMLGAGLEISRGNERVRFANPVEQSDAGASYQDYERMEVDSQDDYERTAAVKNPQTQALSLAPQTEHPEKLSPALRSRKQFLLELCVELEGSIGKIQSALAKNVITKKIDAGRKLASENKSGDTIEEVEKQISALQKLGAQNNLLAK